MRAIGGCRRPRCSVHCQCHVVDQWRSTRRHKVGDGESGQRLLTRLHELRLGAAAGEGYKTIHEQPAASDARGAGSARSRCVARLCGERVTTSGTDPNFCTHASGEHIHSGRALEIARSRPRARDRALETGYVRAMLARLAGRVQIGYMPTGLGMRMRATCTTVTTRWPRSRLCWGTHHH